MPLLQPVEESDFQFGKGRIIKEGYDCTIVANGETVYPAVQAASLLEEEHNITATVISMHTIKPFDSEAVLKACRETGGIVTVEEHTIHGGLGSLVAETCMDAGVKPNVFRRIGLRAGFSSIVGAQEYLRREYGMDPKAIAKAVAEHPRITSTIKSFIIPLPSIDD